MASRAARAAMSSRSESDSSRADRACRRCISARGTLPPRPGDCCRHEPIRGDGARYETDADVAVGVGTGSGFASLTSAASFAAAAAASGTGTAAAGVARAGGASRCVGVACTRLFCVGVSSSSESNMTLRRRSISCWLARGVIMDAESPEADAAAARAWCSSSSSSSKPLNTRCSVCCRLPPPRGVARDPRLSSWSRGTPVVIAGLCVMIRGPRKRMRWDPSFQFEETGRHPASCIKNKIVPLSHRRKRGQSQTGTSRRRRQPRSKSTGNFIGTSDRFMPAIASTSGRFHCELLRRLFLPRATLCTLL